MIAFSGRDPNPVRSRTNGTRGPHKRTSSAHKSAGFADLPTDESQVAWPHTIREEKGCACRGFKAPGRRRIESDCWSAERTTGRGQRPRGRVRGGRRLRRRGPMSRDPGAADGARPRRRDRCRGHRCGAGRRGCLAHPPGRSPARAGRRRPATHDASRRAAARRAHTRMGLVRLGLQRRAHDRVCTSRPPQWRDPPAARRPAGAHGGPSPPTTATSPGHAADIA